MQMPLPILFDSHAHHPEKTFSPSKDFQLFACFSGFSPQTNAEVMEYARTNDNCVFSLGLAPQDVIRTEKPEELLADLKEKAKSAMSDPSLKNKFAAIGECGLDYHWAKEEAQHEAQRVIFSKAIEFAKSIGKPLVIHSRDAEGDCIDMLEGAGCKKVLMHCFGGNLKMALHAESLGYLVSIPPVPSSERKKIIKGLKITSLAVESDAPYIGKACADSQNAAEMIARYRQIALADAVFASGGCAKRFFGVE